MTAPIEPGMAWHLWSGEYPPEASNAFRVALFLRDWLRTSYEFIVDHPDHVNVDAVVWKCGPNIYGAEFGVSLTITVHPEDEALAIGGRAIIIRSFKAYANAIQGKEGMPVRIHLETSEER